MTFTHVYTLLCTMKRSPVLRLHVYTCTYRNYNNILLLYRIYRNRENVICVCKRVNRVNAHPH